MFEDSNDSGWSNLAALIAFFWILRFAFRASPAWPNTRAKRTEQYVAAEDYANAEKLLRQDLSKKERKLGADDIEVSMVLNNLGKVLLRKGDPGAAEDAFRRALLIEQKALGMNSPDLVSTLNWLAASMQAKGAQEAVVHLSRRVP